MNFVTPPVIVCVLEWTFSHHVPPLPVTDSDDPSFSTFAGFDWGSEDVNSGNFEGTDFSDATYNTSVKEFFKKSDMNSKNMTYFKTWNEQNPASSQQCFDMKCSRLDTDITSKQCDQTNTRPLCNLQLWKRTQPECLVFDNGVKQCGTRVPKYNTLDILGKFKLDHNNPSNEYGIRVAFGYMISRMMITYPNVTTWPIMPEPWIMQPVGTVPGSGFCECQCPSELPIFNDINLDTSRSYIINNQGTQQNLTQSTWNSMEKTAFSAGNPSLTYCCAENYLIQADSGSVFEIDRTKTCLTIFCRDDSDFYQNLDNLFYNLTSGKIDTRINSGAGFYTTPVVGTGSKINGEITASCKPIVCPSNLPTPSVENVGSFDSIEVVENDDVELNHANYECSQGFCGRVVMDCSYTSGIVKSAIWLENSATGSCSAQRCEVLSLDNGSVDVDSDNDYVNVGASANYTCKTGFRLVQGVSANVPQNKI